MDHEEDLVVQEIANSSEDEQQNELNVQENGY